MPARGSNSEGDGVRPPVKDARRVPDPKPVSKHRKQAGGGNAVRRKRARIQSRKPKPSKDRAAGQAVEVSRADRVIAFLECLTTTAGPSAGKPFILREWQRDIIRAIYDPADPTTGWRTVRTALLSMARKNGKTELAAGLALCHLCGPEAELNGQVYSAAADRFQAALVYNAAAAMVRADPELDSTQGGLLTIVDSQKRIVCHQNGSFYQALSSESKTKHGFNASCIIYDELAQAPNRHLFDVLTTSTGARAQPLTLVISTQSPDPHSVMTELVEYGRKVEAGAFPDASFRMFLYEIPDEMDVWDEANWPLANPALGDFRSLEEMRVKAAQARRLPSAEMAFRNLYCNQRIDAEARFVPPTVWRACAATLELASFRGRQCWAALDLSAVHDLTALSVVFPRGVNEFDALAWFWLPAEGLRDKADQDRVPYPEWQAAGWLETIPGRAIRKDVVARRVADILSPFDCRQLFCDPWRIEEFMPHWSDLGVPIPLEEFQQTYRSFGPAVDTLERALLDQRLRHQGSPILTWHIANVVVTADSAGNRKFDKSKSTARIDGAVALLMALQRASSALDLRSPYERQGITVLN